MVRWEILEKLINENQCRFVAEIGVRGGHIPWYLLHRSKIIEKYYAVDDDFSVLNKALISRFPHIFVPCNLTSKEASKVVQNNLDLVFIDANHGYDYVKEDIELWIPKTKKGGIICGHDYSDTYCLGVKRAVHEFFGDDFNLEFEGKVYIWWRKNV